MGSAPVNILIVDDERRTCDYVAAILSGKGWRVDKAHNGAQALNLAGRTKYNAVVLDYRLPGMDGAELCRRLRDVQPQVRGVFLTGFPTIDTVYPAMAAGADRVLAKPVNPTELVRTLEEQLGEQTRARGQTEE